jgi:uncharacterized Zn-finger protein
MSNIDCRPGRAGVFPFLINISLIFLKRSLQSCGKRSESKPIHQMMATVCKHPRVRIVSRLEDTEFVECQECGEVFDSEEFRDMELEETADPEETLDDL